MSASYAHSGLQSPTRSAELCPSSDMVPESTVFAMEVIPSVRFVVTKTSVSQSSGSLLQADCFGCCPELMKNRRTVRLGLCILAKCGAAKGDLPRLRFVSSSRLLKSKFCQLMPNR